VQNLGGKEKRAGEAIIEEDLMNINIKTALCIFVIALLFYSGAVAQKSNSNNKPKDNGASKKIKICFQDVDWPPYTFGPNSRFNGQGALPELLTYIEQDVDVKFEFFAIPWKRCQKIVALNEMDGALETSFREERLKMGRFPWKDGGPDATRRTHASTYVLYKAKDSMFELTDSDNNDMAPVAVERGYAGGSDLKKMGVNVIEVATPEAGMNMVISGRTLGFMTLEDVADYIIEKNNYFSEHISKSSKPFKIKNYYLLFSHGFYNDNPKTSEQIWDMIRKYVEAGKMKEFYKKWVGRAAQK
jgi:polar amino acid transport system substrate-binding protein